MNDQPRATALLVIDVQHAFDIIEASGVPRNNPQATAQIAQLLEVFRACDQPIFHIHHHSTDPNSLFAPDHPGVRVQAIAREIDGETVIIKRVNSAFIGTDLEAQLRAAQIQRLVICGATTNHCVETTTRMAGNLGFDPWLVRDATWTFARTSSDQDHYTPEQIHAMSLANLHGEFATITTTAEVLALMREI